MELERRYERTLFDASVLEDAIREFSKEGRGDQSRRTIERGSDRWTFDSDEEFLAEWRKGFSYASFSSFKSGHTLAITAHSSGTTVIVVSAASRPEIEKVMAIFDRQAEAARLPPPPTERPTTSPPVVFIGHGRSQQWRDLKDHLREKHGYRIEAYEIGERAGHTIRDILESMLEASSFAILVMTAEDEQASGEYRPRQNVVHELGLFQGRLGFNRAIVLLEEGTEGFSNIQGIHQTRYAKGNIRETFGDVLAALRREFAGGEAEPRFDSDA